MDWGIKSGLLLLLYCSAATDAEKAHDALIFIPGLRDFRWKEDSTACWRFPNGKLRGGIEDKMDHPVTTIRERSPDRR